MVETAAAVMAISSGSDGGNNHQKLTVMDFVCCG